MDEFIPVYQPELSGNELNYVVDCVKSSWISSLGKYVPLFEEGFAHFCNTNHAIALMNGTVALHLAMILFEIGPGDEVIVPTLTFVATANAVRYTGAAPIFVDVSKDTWTLDPDLLEKKITSRTKAIIPVHLYGHPAYMGPILEIANKYGLFVIEDAAEAHGAEYLGRKVGGLGQIGCFSFYGNKIITSGEGGMLVTNNDELAEKARLLKDHGMSKDIRYWHPIIGYNYRMTNIQAAIGLAQLERIEPILARKREIAELYHAGLVNCPGVLRQPEAAWAKSVYWMYSVIITDDTHMNRDQLMKALLERGIDSRPFFFPMHQLPPYQSDDNNYPVADNLSINGINLPSYTTLRDEQVEYICKTICELCRN